MKPDVCICGVRPKVYTDRKASGGFFLGTRWHEVEPAIYSCTCYNHPCKVGEVYARIQSESKAEVIKAWNEYIAKKKSQNSY